MIDLTKIEPFHPPLPFQPPRGPVNYMSTPNIYGLIRHLCIETGGPYLEIGSYRGQGLLAAGRGNKVKCIGIDSYTGVGWRPENEEICREQIAPYKNIKLIKGDFEKVLKGIKNKFRVAFIDGPHDADGTESQLKLSAEKLYKTGDCFMIVDDLNFTGVALGLDRFLKSDAGKGFKVVFEQRTKDRNHPVWWNGICVIQRK